MQIIVCISIALFLIVGIILGTVFAVREATAYVKYGGIYLSEGEVNYFASRYKAKYIAELQSKEIGVYDNELFWRFEKDKSGKTYGEILSERTRKYIGEIVYAASVFENNSSLTSSQERYINTLINDRLNSVSDGSIDNFNLDCAEYGFNYDNMKNAVTVEYKAALARAVLYGTDGGNVANIHPDELEPYLNTYSHVKMLFIDFGSASSSEREEKEAVVSEIRTLIDNYKNNLDGSMTPTAFDVYLSENNDGDDTFNSDGCYFKSGSNFTESFRQSYPTVLDKALSMDMGYDEVVYESGVCFIYKYSPDVSSLLVTGNSDTLTDFYYLLSKYVFDKEIIAGRDLVDFTDKYSLIDVVNIKKNGIYGVNLG